MTTPRHRPPATRSIEVEYLDATVSRPPVEVHRSFRRRRGGQAALRDGRVVVRIPAGLPPEEDRAMVDALLDKVLRARRTEARGGDAWLRARAELLADRYLDGIRPSDVRWSKRMQHRWGSCTRATGEIRISDRLAPVPDLVLDYVLVHELAHLLVPGHPPHFHALVDRYPHRQRAQGFLEGYEAGRGVANRAVNDAAPLGCISDES